MTATLNTFLLSSIHPWFSFLGLIVVMESAAILCFQPPQNIRPSSATSVFPDSFLSPHGQRSPTLKKLRGDTLGASAASSLSLAPLSSTKKVALTEGIRVPSASWPVRVKNDQTEEFAWGTLTSDDIFRGRRVVFLALPGAFTPTCASLHLPEYENQYDEFKKLGIDDVYCLSVNDTFVMNAWKKELGIKKVQMIPDGNGSFSEALGTLVEKSNLGFGNRSWRFSMVVNDGTVEKVFLEPGMRENSPEDPFGASSAATMLSYLKSKAASSHK